MAHVHVSSIDRSPSPFTPPMVAEEEKAPVVQEATPQEKGSEPDAAVAADAAEEKEKTEEAEPAEPKAADGGADAESAGAANGAPSPAVATADSEGKKSPAPSETSSQVSSAAPSVPAIKLPGGGASPASPAGTDGRSEVYYFPIAAAAGAARSAFCSECTIVAFCASSRVYADEKARFLLCRWRVRRAARRAVWACTRCAAWTAARRARGGLFGPLAAASGAALRLAASARGVPADGVAAA